MAVYAVTRLIKSAAHLWEPHDVDGITFRSLDSPPSDDVLVSGDQEAGNYREASLLFDEHLMEVIDAISVVAGAALLPVGGSTLIEKKRGKYAYLQAVWRRPSARLAIHRGFNTDLLNEAARVAQELRKDKTKRFASHYLRQAALAGTLRTVTFHALQAAEALAPRRGGRWTDHARLRDVMGDDLYDYFYGEDVPLLNGTRRNALAHGRLVPEEGLGQRAEDLLRRLLSRLRSEFGVSAHRAFTPIRGFVTLERMALFIEPLSPMPNLRDLVAMARDGNLHSQSDPRWVGIDVSKRLLGRW